MRRAIAMIVAAVLTAALPGAALASFTVSGTALYQDREWNYNGYTGNLPELPIRYADIEIVNNANGSILGEGYTDGSGNFSVFVSASGTYSIYVRIVADSLNARAGESEISRVRVADFGSDATFTAVSSVVSGVNSNTNVGSVVVNAVTESNGKLGNPFNMFDLVISCLLYVAGPLNDSRPSSSTTIKVRWPSTGSGSYASGSTTVIGYKSGYDDCIILHELGHIFHNVYSDSDNPGGSHGFGGTDQDPRLSFGEGWATYFEMCVLDFIGHPDPGVYVNTTGDPGPGNLSWHARAEDGSPYSSTGAASEWAIVCAEWDRHDNELTSDFGPAGFDDDAFDLSVNWGSSNPDREGWEVMVGPVSSASNLTYIDFWDGWFSPVDHGFHAECVAITNAWGIYFNNDGDEYNGSAATATPIPATGAWSSRKSIYYSSSTPPAPGAGDRDYFSFFVSSGTDLEIETRYDQGNAASLVDPYLDLIAPNGVTVLASNDDGGDGRNAKILYTTTQTGTHYARVRESDSYRDYGHYNVRVRITGTTSVPVIDTISPDSALINGGLVATITGANFVGDVDVYFGSKQANGVQIIDINTLTCLVPLGDQLGPVQVVVENEIGSSPPLVNGFAYESLLSLVGTPEPGETITLAVLGKPNADLGIVKDTQLGPKSKKGILWQIKFGPGFEILRDSFRTSDSGTSGFGQANVPYDIPDDPGLVGTSLYFESVFDNALNPPRELYYGNFLEVIIE